MPRTETEMLWHVKGEFSQSPPMWKQIRNTQERTLFMATAAKTTTKPAGTPVETGRVRIGTMEVGRHPSG